MKFASKTERNRKKEKYREKRENIHSKKMLDVTLDEMTKLTGLQESKSLKMLRSNRMERERTKKTLFPQIRVSKKDFLRINKSPYKLHTLRNRTK